jgi:hypothetical protein
MEFWGTLWTSLGGGAVASAVVAFLAREWISTRIRKAIEHEYQVKEMKLKGQLDGELEGLRAGYKKVLDENQIRFSRLYAEQADAIKTVYQLLVDLESKMKTFVNPLQFAPKDPQKAAEFFDQQHKDATDSYNECNTRYRKLRIFLPERVCQDIDKLLEIARKAYTESRQDERDPEVEPFDAMRGPFQSIRKQLEDRFRELLGLLPGIESVATQNEGTS